MTRRFELRLGTGRSYLHDNYGDAISALRLTYRLRSHLEPYVVLIDAEGCFRRFCWYHLQPDAGCLLEFPLARMGITGTGVGVREINGP